MVYQGSAGGRQTSPKTKPPKKKKKIEIKKIKKITQLLLRGVYVYVFLKPHSELCYVIWKFFFLSSFLSSGGWWCQPARYHVRAKICRGFPGCYSYYIHTYQKKKKKEWGRRRKKEKKKHFIIRVVGRKFSDQLGPHFGPGKVTLIIPH